MKKLLSLYKANDSLSNMSKSLEIVFNFVFVACASLILSGFVVNNERTNWHQMFFMMLNASILTTHWFAYTVFRQRYEKKKIYYRVNTMMQVMSLGMIAVGIDLLTFRLSGTAHGKNIVGVTDGQKWFSGKDIDHLQQVGLIIWLAGIISSRIIVSGNFFLAYKANKSNSSMIPLTIYKSISRLLVVILAIVHLVLNIVVPEHIDLYIYSFLPAYLIIEWVGNYWGVNDKNLKGATPVSFKYMNERYSNLLILYISSIFVAGTVQFAFYFKKDGDEYMIARVAMMYIIGFLLWWLHSDRMHRFTMKSQTKYLHMLSIITVIMSPALAVFGGALINSHNNDNLNWIIPAMFFSFAVMLVMYFVVIKVFENKTETETLSRKTKLELALQLIPFIIISLVLGILSIYFSFSIWVAYGTIIGSLVVLAILSRVTIKYRVKNN